MKNCVRLAFAYIKYYKKQTMALFFGVILSAALLTGIGSLIGSGRNAALENSREKYGDWHYSMRCDYPWFLDFDRHMSGNGYQVEEAGVTAVRKMIEEPYQITMLYADTGYLRMMGRKMEKGRYPIEKNEVAMDVYSLRNMGITEKPGSTVVLDGEEFTLSGIVSDMPEIDRMQVFVSEELDYGKNGSFLYLKFEESHGVYKQMLKMADTLGMDKTRIASNKIVSYVGGEAPAALWDTVKTGFTMEGARLPYIWAVLNKSWNLTEKAILAALGLFGVFIIYSLFQISVIKRMSQYSIMQTVGMEGRTTFGVLAAELAMVFVPGYLAGCLLGNGAAAFLYRRSGKIFVQPEEFLSHSGVETAQTVANIPEAGEFHVSVSVMTVGAVFILLLILLIVWRLVWRMNKRTARELQAKESGKKHKNRKIYSIKTGNLAGVLTKKFMFARKGAFIGMLLSLSAGCLIFLGATYVADNTRRNNELTFKADDGLGSDIQIYEETDKLTDTVPEGAAEQLRAIPELETVSPVRYMLGELPLLDGSFKWPSFFAETAGQEEFEPNPEIMEKYNGVAVQTGEGDYKLKVNIYGYDDEMLEALEAYLLEGEIDPEQMRAQNTVILKTLMDGQGNYDGLAVLPGDTITLKTPVSQEASQEVLRFLSADDQYQEQQFQVAALTSRPMAKVDTFIGDSGRDEVDIIMTNEQMKQNFKVTGFHAISINLKEGADAEQVANDIRQVISGIPKCVVKDYTEQIEVQNLFLSQKMMFFYGIALMLLIISLIHVMNSMQYLVTARKHEFGILRAMGITDTGFRKMLVKEGLRYGMYSSAVMLILYMIVQKILYYFMVKVYLYIHPQTQLSIIPLVIMTGINIVICTAAVLISGQQVLKEQIIDEIHE